ncbi:MAG: hypothetical protein ABIS26_01395 [Candidatus Paceibacterota bacterium]
MTEDNKTTNKEKAWWQPVMIFYVKTAGWIMIPLLVALFLGNYVKETTQSQALFFGSIMLGFAITCYGIYREIKTYKKDLEKNGK